MNEIKQMLEDIKKAGLKFSYRINSSSVYLKCEDQTDMRIQLKESIRRLAENLGISLMLDTSALDKLTLKKQNKFGGWRYVCTFWLEGESTQWN
jgi:hypothetical protein